jgi:thiamine kinase-like enzyme
MDNSERLEGGNSNQVIKQGNTVVRQTGAWSPFVHQLLKHLQANSFEQAPVLLEATENSERLSFIEGEVGNYPLKPYMLSDEILVEAAKLLRHLHDITRDFVVSPDAQFFLPVDSNEKWEVICHNDFAPYNLVFKDSHIIAIIDFDTAAPGKRIWDIAYAVYRFAPLTTDEHCLACGWQTIPNRVARLKLFCDIYGLEDRSELIAAVSKRLNALVQYMEANSANLEHIPIYLADLEYISDNQHTFSNAIST